MKVKRSVRITLDAGSNASPRSNHDPVAATDGTKAGTASSSVEARKSEQKNSGIEESNETLKKLRLTKKSLKMKGPTLHTERRARQRTPVINKFKSDYNPRQPLKVA